MKINKMITQNSRSYINAGLLSLILSIPLLSNESSKENLPGINDPTITIRKGKNVTTLINVVTVEPENEQKVLALFKEGTETLFSKQPGFIAESIHRGVDPKQIVLYGQWEGPEYIEAFKKNPEILKYFSKVSELATFVSVVSTEVTYIKHK